MGLATPKWELMKSFSNAPQIDFPIIVKPNDQGSTLGLSIVEDEKFLKEALDRSFKFSKSIMMESYISGRELAVSILDEMALPIVEIIPSKKIYDYECKYTPGKSSYSCPAELNPIVDYHIKKDSELLFKHLGCKAYGRADFLLDENGNYYFLEMNTLPGMTRTSLFPKASKAAGISFNELILRIIKKSL
jgi:D-alanine-D-alanine ligase